ncbi:MAG: UTP--glucose-1-phosphate uridylyltransferase [Planctomycetota bacterium]
MLHDLIAMITTSDPTVRNRSLDGFCRTADVAALRDAARSLDAFRRRSENLYERVRATFFLAAIYRYHLPAKLPPSAKGLVPFEGYCRLLGRRFEEAVDEFRAVEERFGPSDAIASALAAAYQALGFQTLADQVRRSVRSVRGNQWMFRMGHPADHPLEIRPALKHRAVPGQPFPILVERTAVRMDLSHSGWSDIFFLGMDYPQGARVLNVSIDLGVRGRDAQPQPPIEAWLRVIDQPVLRLTSIDLKCKADVTTLADVFDFAKDYLGLLKAAVIAAGIIPSGLEGSGQTLADVLAQLVGPGLGLEIVSRVHDIPKGSRLAVSTNLLAAIITVCMRATGQIESLSGSLSEAERKLVAARAILGEWLGGSGGGWQDSGGIWPGMKMIEGREAQPDDPEYGISLGRLLPDHHIYTEQEVSPRTRQLIHDSFVLVHGGMAQNVGPVLEMVTEKYLLRSEAEWTARQEAIELLRAIEKALAGGDVREIAQLTTRNFFGPIQTIIPWASNHYTETLIELVRRKFGGDYWGFLMLGGISGGGMGFIFDPARKTEAQDFLQREMVATKRQLQNALPFAMDPVVYDFAINDCGTLAELCADGDAIMPAAYYAICAPDWLRQETRQLSPAVRNEITRFAAACRTHPRLTGSTELLLGALFPQPSEDASGNGSLKSILESNGFDSELHEQIRSDLRTGRISLAQNRLSPNTVIEDVARDDGSVGFQPADHAFDTRTNGLEPADHRAGEAALAGGEVAVLALAGGAGSRWTRGAGVVKALHPFCRFQGKYRNFIEIHLAKGRKTAARFGIPIPIVISTSYLTHEPIERFLQSPQGKAYPGPLLASPGRSVGLRMIPMPRDLRFAWEEMPQQILDVQAQKVRESLHSALIGWAEAARGGSDYTDNVPLQCLHPTGHWFELPNMLRNGTLAQLLHQQPQLKYLLLHNIDTLGANFDPGLLGRHIRNEACLSFEVIPRQIDDRGGGLARVNGRVRLVEGLALPREEDEFRLSYYNSQTTWISIDRLLDVFGLSHKDLNDELEVTRAVRRLSMRLPTYITLKDVKKRWGHAQEDVFPVAQFEKLWSDMTGLGEVACHFIVVSRQRGQQLKDPAQLDGWLRDGSAAYVDSLCEW